MSVPYTYWKSEGGWYIGYINQYPAYRTQGRSIKELEKMLVLLYQDIMEFDDIRFSASECKEGLVAVPV